MANGIPPFLPASPPPMCKLDYYEDDEDDEFGDFSNAGDSCYLESSEPIPKPREVEPITKQVFDPGVPCEIITNHREEINSIPAETSNELLKNSSHSEDLPNTDDLIIDNIEKSSDEKVHSVMENGFSPINISSSPINGISDSDSIDFEIETSRKNCDISGINSINIDGLENSLVLSNALSKEISNSTDFTEFCGIDIPTSNSSNEQIEQITLKEELPVYNDDSNLPDIKFDCFITCPVDDEIDDYSSKNEFSDFNEPAESNFFNKNCTVHENITFDSELANDKPVSMDIEPMTIVTNKKIEEEVLSSHADNGFNDDEFSDFVSNYPPQKEEVFCKNDDFEPFDDCFISTDNDVQNKTDSFPLTSSQVVVVEGFYDLNSETWNEVFKFSGEEQIEVNLNTLEGKLNSSSVWCKIKDIESSPALNYNWNNSETNKVLLSALYVDSRNILFGPRWNSEVPRFASNLGFSPLVPEKAFNKNESTVIDPLPESSSEPAPIFTEILDSVSQVPSSVPDAHFDWNNSGLTNPLDSYSHSSLLDLDLLASFDIHSPYYKKNRKDEKIKDGKLDRVSHHDSLFDKSPQKQLSEEAKEVLNNLPSLLVMEKQYIVFPIS